MANPNPMFLSRTRPFSLRHARSLFGVSDPAKIALLIESLIGDYGTVREECCFALDTNKWTTAVTAGGGPTAFAYSAVRGGTFQGQTGATDGDATAIHAANTFLDPDDMPFFICRFKINAVTGVSIEVGMSDPKSDEALPGVTDVDTPTVGNGLYADSEHVSDMARRGEAEPQLRARLQRRGADRLFLSGKRPGFRRPGPALRTVQDAQHSLQDHRHRLDVLRLGA